MIPGPATEPALLEFITGFADRRLGKGVVPCKDTPNFIGNRIGFFFLGTLAKITVEGEYTVEEVDALTGPLIGLPNSATFRLLDIVGLDVCSFVGNNLYHAVPGDPWRSTVPPAGLPQPDDEARLAGRKNPDRGTTSAWGRTNKSRPSI